MGRLVDWRGIVWNDLLVAGRPQEEVLPSEFAPVSSPLPAPPFGDPLVPFTDSVGTSWGRVGLGIRGTLGPMLQPPSSALVVLQYTLEAELVAIEAGGATGIQSMVGLVTIKLERPGGSYSSGLRLGESEGLRQTLVVPTLADTAGTYTFTVSGVLEASAEQVAATPQRVLSATAT